MGDVGALGAQTHKANFGFAGPSALRGPASRTGHSGGRLGGAGSSTASRLRGAGCPFAARTWTLNRGRSRAVSPGRHASPGREVISTRRVVRGGGDASRRTTPVKSRNREKVMPIGQMIQRRCERSTWIG
jgi:hypothetical protein